MKTTIVSISIIFILVFGGSLSYSNYCYCQYRNLWPNRDPVGLLTGIRAWFGAYDSNDIDLSEECRMYFDRSKMAAMAALLTWILFIVFILLVRSFGLEKVLDQ